VPVIFIWRLSFDARFHSEAHPPLQEYPASSKPFTVTPEVVWDTLVASQPRKEFSSIVKRLDEGFPNSAKVWACISGTIVSVTAITAADMYFMVFFYCWLEIIRKVLGICGITGKVAALHQKDRGSSGNDQSIPGWIAENWFLPIGPIPEKCSCRSVGVDLNSVRDICIGTGSPIGNVLNAKGKKSGVDWKILGEECLP